MISPRDSTIEALKLYGLSQPQIKTIMALVEIGSGEPSSIAAKAEVKQPKIYAHLNSLVEEELITMIPIEGKPNRYEANIDTIITKINDYMQESALKVEIAKYYLEMMKTQEKKSDITDFIRIIQGERAVDIGLKDIITEVETNIIILSNPYYKQRIDNIIIDLMELKPDTTIINRDIMSIFSNIIPKIMDAKKAKKQMNLAKLFEHRRPTIFFIDVDFQNLTADSANFCLPPIEGMGPIIIQFKHPSIVNSQLSIINIIASLSEIIEI